MPFFDKENTAEAMRANTGRVGRPRQNLTSTTYHHRNDRTPTPHAPVLTTSSLRITDIRSSLCVSVADPRCVQRFPTRPDARAHAASFPHVSI